MDIDTFWQLIEDSLAHAPGRIARQAFLRDRLSVLPAAEIIGFRAQLDRSENRAYSWDLAGAATRIFGGWLSEDGFEYFRLWLIGRGRAAFEQAVAGPDSLAGLPEIGRLAGRRWTTWVADTEWPEWESLAYVAIDAYARATGDDDECAEAFYEALKARLSDDAFVGASRGDHWDARDETAALVRIPDLAAMFPLDS